MVDPRRPGHDNSNITITCLFLGNLVIKSCGAKEVSDFYPIFYNPVPDFVHEIDCVSEVVHPL